MVIENLSSSSASNGQIVIVTGAGGHLGHAIVSRLIKDGFNCVVVDTDNDAVKALVELGGGGVVGVVGDVRSSQDRARLMERCGEQAGSLFGLVNNAGIGRLRPLLDESVQDWRDTFAVNLEAAFFLSQLAIEEMRRSGGGRIVNIASMHGVIGGTGARISTEMGERGPIKGSAYAASKGGLIQLTRDLAAAVGPWNILVNSVSPGQCPRTSGGGGDAREASKPSGLGDRIDSHAIDAMAAQIPVRRVGRAAEIAGPVSFLLSADATYVTGANIVVDGGFSIC